MVLPSYREGTPKAILEAMAMGRAIITTNAPGCKETVIDGKNGFLISVGSIEQLIKKMEICIKNSDLLENMSKESYNLVCNKFDVNMVNQDICKIMKI